MWKRSAGEGGAHVAHRTGERVNRHAAGVDDLHLNCLARLDGADTGDILLIFGCVAAHVEDAFVDAAGVPVVIDRELWQVELEVACDVHGLGVGPYIEGVGHSSVGSQPCNVCIAHVGRDGGSCVELQRAHVGDVGVVHLGGCGALAKAHEKG